MKKIPILSYKRVIKALTKLGFTPRRQTGSHIILTIDSPKYLAVSVPMHKELKRGTLHAILDQAGIDPDKFLKLV